MPRKFFYISLFFALAAAIFSWVVFRGRDEAGKAERNPGNVPASMDSDYMKEVPKDYNLDMPDPTPEEAAENLAKAAKAAAEDGKAGKK